MRMPGVEMGQYGVLPETDPFTVVVCDLCKAAVKPQGLQKHVHRHNQAAAAVTTSDVNTLASLIPPCIVSVNALKFDPKAENSNSSTSSVYNLAGGGGSFEASSSSSSNQGPADGVVASSSSSFLHEQQQDFVNVTANTPPPTAILSKSGGKPGSLKIKLSKSAMKSGGGGGGGNTICSSSSSSSSSSTSTSTSSMTNLIGNRSVSASPNVPPATASSSNDHPPPTVEPPPIPAPTKKLGLKEREYDANKHCGVLLDTGKHCTRTLTCKSHALSLRRQVSGRSAEFDKLLADHRAMRAALLASGGKAAATTPVLLPPPPVPVAPTAVESQSSSLKRESSDNNNNGHSHSHSHHHHHHRHHHDRLDSQPPAKRQHMERQSSRSERNSHRGGEVTNSKHNQVGASMKMKIKAEPMDEEAEGGGGDNEATPTLEDPPPFRGNNNNSHHHHSNGFELHGRSQLVASSNGGYFIKSESQLATDEMIVETATNPGKALELENDADFHHHHQVDVDEEAEKLKAPSIITVPVTMLGNVMYVNGRNCILEAAAPTSIDEEQGEEETENRPFEIAGTKGRHVEVVLDRESGERRRYLTLSAGQQQRATNRMRLNVIKTEQATDVGKNNNGDQSVVISAAEFPGIDTWYTQIPKPTYVNCFKLCKLGTSSAVLSKRYLNIRKSLIMNMTSSGGHLHHHAHSHHHHLHQGGSPVSALNRSNSQSGNSPGGGGGGSRLLNSGAGSGAGAAVGGGGGGGFGGVEKVNFNVERIKV